MDCPSYLDLVAYSLLLKKLHFGNLKIQNGGFKMAVLLQNFTFLPSFPDELLLSGIVMYLLKDLIINYKYI